MLVGLWHFSERPLRCPFASWPRLPHRTQIQYGSQKASSWDPCTLLVPRASWVLGRGSAVGGPGHSRESQSFMTLLQDNLLTELRQSRQLHLALRLTSVWVVCAWAAIIAEGFDLLSILLTCLEEGALFSFSNAFKVARIILSRTRAEVATAHL